MNKIGILGAGSWGTALGILLSKNGHDVTIWSISEDEVCMLREKREHKDKLPGVKVPENICITADIEEAVKGKDICVMAVPSTFTRSTAELKKIH